MPTFSSKNFLLSLASAGGSARLRSRYHFLTTCPLQQAWILVSEGAVRARPRPAAPAWGPRAGPAPRGALGPEQLGPVANDAGLVLALPAERTGLLARELLEGLEARLRRHGPKSSRAIAHKHRFHF